MFGIQVSAHQASSFFVHPWTRAAALGLVERKEARKLVTGWVPPSPAFQTGYSLVSCIRSYSDHPFKSRI